MNYILQQRIYSHTPLNLCGTLNFKTGNCRWFNVREDGTHIAVYYCHGTGQKIAVGGCGHPPIGTKKRFYNSQTFRELLGGHEFEVIETVTATDEGLKLLEQHHGKTIRFFTLD
jgi:hypothetical protein